MSVTIRIDGPRREDVLLLCLVLLQDVVLDRPAEEPGSARRRLRGGGDVHREQDRRRRVDRHRRRHLAEVDAGEEVLHVGEGVDGDAAAPDLALDEGVVRVAAHRASAGRRRPRARRRRSAAALGSGRSCPRPCRSRRTCASSTASSGTSRRTGPGCRGRCPEGELLAARRQLRGAGRTWSRTGRLEAGPIRRAPARRPPPRSPPRPPSLRGGPLPSVGGRWAT